MTDINPDYIALDEEMGERELDSSPIQLLEKIKQEGKSWADLSKEYGVENPDPPWRVSLESTCDQLANSDSSPLNSCGIEAKKEEVNTDPVVDPIERRWEEDKLVDELYADVPFPERQLLALAHTMIRRGILSEKELDVHMKKVAKRLNMEDGAYSEEKLSDLSVKH
tara:strand:- start:3137 stop:3637 length:501 start_codon:yes stop_codon:yes gene_type:complete